MIRKILLFLVFNILLSKSLFAGEVTIDLSSNTQEAVDTYSEILLNTIQEDLDLFIKQRNEISLRLKQIYPKNYTYWLRQIDHRFKEKYFHFLAEFIRSIDHSLSEKYANFIEEILKQDQNEKIHWMDDLMYNTHGRGAYNSEDKTVFLQLSSFSSILVPVIHELTHAMDEELNFARHHLESIRDSKPTEYDFYKRLYLPYYKELVPRLISCEFYLAYKKSAKEKRNSGVDDEYLKRVLNSEINCHQWTYDSYFPHRKLNYYWYEGSPQRESLKQYELDWLKKWGFDRSFGQR